MDDRITPGRFHAAEGVDDWRVVLDHAAAHFSTGSFARGVALVDAIGGLADAADHHPDVDLRYGGVAVRLVSHDVGGLSERDLALARQISAAARDLGIAADPDAVQDVRITVDALLTKDVQPFWRAVLGYDEVDDDTLTDPRGRSPRVRFQRMDAARPQRNRVHVDVVVPHDRAEARVAAALHAGGRMVSGAYAPAWWTLADAEGNEVDVMTAPHDG